MAAVNNAEWCASVWRSHGLTVERSEGLYFCRSETPRFYPNVVTVDPSWDAGAQLQLIGDLTRGADFEFSVKDSFDRLPLRRAGFVRVFSACWLLRELRAYGGEPLHGWRAVTGDDLCEWEAAWAAGDRDATGIFRRGLLDDDRVTILALGGGARPIIAGAITFATDGVAGLTNAFGAATGLFKAVGYWTSSETLVAYEPGVSGDEAKRRGFHPLGPLSVWRRPRPNVA